MLAEDLVTNIVSFISVHSWCPVGAFRWYNMYGNYTRVPNKHKTLQLHPYHIKIFKENSTLYL